MSTKRTAKKVNTTLADANVIANQVSVTTPEVVNTPAVELTELPDVETITKVVKTTSASASTEDLSSPMPGMIKPNNAVATSTSTKVKSKVSKQLKQKLTEYIASTKNGSELDQITNLYQLYQAMIRNTCFDDYAYILDFYVQNPGFITSINSLRGVNSLPKDARNFVAGINTLFYHVVNYLVKGLKMHLSIAAAQVTLSRKADTFVTFLAMKMPMEQ